MIQNNFTKNSLNIQIRKGKFCGSNTENVILNIDSDYSKSERKSSLYVNEKRLAGDLEVLWKSIKTKKLKSIQVSFDEIDYYDNMTNVYTTPTVKIERGLRKAKVRYHEHGSIPKDWSFSLAANFSDLKTLAPVMEVIKAVLPGGVLRPDTEKEMRKELLTFLKKGNAYYSFE